MPKFVGQTFTERNEAETYNPQSNKRRHIEESDSVGPLDLALAHLLVTILDPNCSRICVLAVGRAGHQAGLLRPRRYLLGASFPTNRRTLVACSLDGLAEALAYLQAMLDRMHRDLGAMAKDSGRNNGVGVLIRERPVVRG